jgi:hypothetical protein
LEEYAASISGCPEDEGNKFLRNSGNDLPGLGVNISVIRIAFIGNELGTEYPEL